MALLPPDTRAQYQGALVPVWIAGAYGLLRIVTGGLHLFLPDGGAGRIADIDLSTRADTIIALFAWAGATQLPWGILLLGIAVYWRSLVPVALALACTEQTLIALNGWVLRSVDSETTPPGIIGAIVFALVLAAACAWSLRRR